MIIKVVTVKYVKIHRILFFFSLLIKRYIKTKIEMTKKIDEIFLLIGEKKLIKRPIKPIKTKPNKLSL